LKRLALVLILALFISPAMADVAEDRAYFAENLESCKTLPAHDTRSQLECVVDQVMSLDAYLGDILAETYGFVSEADARLLRRAQESWEQYRARTCAYHKSLADGDPALAELFCVLRITNLRIAEILANEGFADPAGTQ
jgi:uncharacterized protein YecT (DUF1311 family)